jgi:hypothetical protein
MPRPRTEPWRCPSSCSAAANESASCAPRTSRILSSATSRCTGHTDLISYEGKRTDFFGHSYFTSNPRVSSDLIQLIRYGKGPGDPGRDLIQTGRVTWRFPVEQDRP